MVYQSSSRSSFSLRQRRRQNSAARLPLRESTGAAQYVQVPCILLVSMIQRERGVGGDIILTTQHNNFVIKYVCVK